MIVTLVMQMSPSYSFALLKHHFSRHCNKPALSDTCISICCCMRTAFSFLNCFFIKRATQLSVRFVKRPGHQAFRWLPSTSGCANLSCR